MSDSNTLIIDTMSEIAESANYNVVIRDNTLKLVNRDQDGEAFVATYRVPELVGLTIQFPHPIRRVRSQWVQNIPYPNVLRLEQQTQEAILDVNAYGQDLDVNPLSQVEAEVEAFLVSYYDIAKRPVIRAVIHGIVRHAIGDRVEVFDQYQEIKAEITIDSISYDFDGLQTELSGKSVISHVTDN